VRDRFGLRATASRPLAASISEVFASRKPSIGTPAPYSTCLTSIWARTGMRQIKYDARRTK
jgi:hypothetical protein